MHLIKKISLFAPLLALLAGCAVSSGTNPADQKYFYRLSNAIPNVPAVDFAVLDGPSETTTPNIAYGESTPYVETDLEDLVLFFDLFEAGTSNVIDSLTGDKQDEKSLHLFAIGIFGATPASQQPIARMVQVDSVRTTPQGSARITFVHGWVRASGTQTPPIDFLRSGAINPVVEGVAFAGTRTFSLPAGTYDFSLRISGLGPIAPFLTKTGVVLEANKVYIFLAQGLEGSGGATAPDIRIFEEPIRDP